MSYWLDSLMAYIVYHQHHPKGPCNHSNPHLRQPILALYSFLISQDFNFQWNPKWSKRWFSQNSLPSFHFDISQITDFTSWKVIKVNAVVIYRLKKFNCTTVLFCEKRINYRSGFDKLCRRSFSESFSHYEWETWDSIAVCL